MSTKQAALPQDSPPSLIRLENGDLETNSLADLVQWFLSYDERTARMRHPHTDELFQWKQADDADRGIAIYPFENAEARFAIGVFQALGENNSEPLLRRWISSVLNALHQARESKAEISEAYGLDASDESSALKKAEKLTTKVEKRLFLTRCWLEALCTAEARVLGWIYQSRYDRPFEPIE